MSDDPQQSPAPEQKPKALITRDLTLSKAVSAVSGAITENSTMAAMIATEEEHRRVDQHLGFLFWGGALLGIITHRVLLILGRNSISRR